MQINEATAELEAARKDCRNGDYGAALEKLDLLCTEQPDDIEIRYARALALEGMERYEDALAECDRILAVAEDSGASALRARLRLPALAESRMPAVSGAAGYAVAGDAAVAREVPGESERGLTPEWTIFAIFIFAPLAYALAAASYPGMVNGVEVLVLHFLAAYTRALITLPVAALVLYAGLTFRSMRHGRAAIDLRNATCATGASIALAGIPYVGIPLGLLAGAFVIARLYRVSFRELFDVAAIAFFVLMIGGLLLAIVGVAGAVFFEGVVQFL